MKSLHSVFLTAGLALIGFAVSGCKPGGEAGTDGGGGGGTGGQGSVNPLCPSNTPNDLISDFKLDNSLHAADGRQGGWYTYGDKLGVFPLGSTGYQIDLVEGNPNCSGAGSLHFKGMGFAEWGAATGADFKPRDTADGSYQPKMTYDASGYRGVSFWAKASAPLDGVQVGFPDLYTDQAAPLHDMPDPLDPTMNVCTACTCIYLAGSASNCSPYVVQFGLKGDGGAATLFGGTYANYQLDTTWKRFVILFADTRQDPGNGGYHTPADRLDVAHLTAMAIQINMNYDTTPKSVRDFDLWIDDVSFIK